MRPLVAQIDHVVIESGDEAALHEWFQSRLGLPLAWPLDDWGPIREGGVTVGNCNLGCNHVLDPGSDPAPTIRAVAFEPTMDAEEIRAEVDRRGLMAYEPIVQEALAGSEARGDGSEGPGPEYRAGWANVGVAALASPSLFPFTCQYFHAVPARRAGDRRRLAEAGGGPLGITGLAAVTVGLGGDEEMVDRWRSFLAPTPDAPRGHFALAPGPALRLDVGAATHALVFRVADLDQATSALGDLGIGYDVREGHVRTDPADTLGLDLRLEV